MVSSEWSDEIRQTREGERDRERVSMCERE